MKKFFKTLISLAVYKEPEPKQDFYIPEPSELVSQNMPGKGFSQETQQQSQGESESNSSSQSHGENANCSKLFKNVKDNIDYLRKEFNYPSNRDLGIRELTLKTGEKAFIAFIDGMVNSTIINDFILRPILNVKNLSNSNCTKGTCELEQMLYSTIETNEAKKVENYKDIIQELLSGNTVLYVDGCDFYISCGTKGYEKRGVEKPQVEGVVKGSQEAFNENLRTNITLLRRILKTKDLTSETLTIGQRSNNLCSIVYINGLTNPVIVDEVRRRLKSIKTDFVLGDGFLEQYMEDNHWSLIPTMVATERPDKTASQLLEGKVAVIGEGTPFALIMPITFFDLLHSPEDTSLRWQYGSMLRIIRIFALFVAGLLPGLYVALTTFHSEMIPTDLLIAIAKSRENVPFPTVFEVILMEASFELIREAGIRIPGIVGNTIGIIGALILGQAAVQANIVSPVLIIIIAFTGLGNFALPNFSLAFGIRMIRLIFIVLGALLGFFGMSLGALVLTAALSSTKSFGVPMLSPFAPKTGKSNDAILRKPIFKQEHRPDYTNSLDSTRQPKISRTWIEKAPAGVKTTKQTKNKEAKDEQ